MTNHTDEIGYVKQLRFFVTMRFGTATPIRIFIARSNSRPAAYLLIRAATDGARITEAVAEEFRRLGIARKLIEFAQQRWPDLVAEIREDNQASIALHEASGFKREFSQNGIAIYRFRRPPSASRSSASLDGDIRSIQRETSRLNESGV